MLVVGCGVVAVVIIIIIYYFKNSFFCMSTSSFYNRLVGSGDGGGRGGVGFGRGIGMLLVSFAAVFSLVLFAGDAWAAIGWTYVPSTNSAEGSAPYTGNVGADVTVTVTGAGSNSGTVFYTASGCSSGALDATGAAARFKLPKEEWR